MIDVLKDYYREKRIRRILSFYHEIQPFNPRRRVRFISRDAWVHFILTLTLLLSMFKFTGYLIAAFLAVEISDYIMIRGTKFFDAIFDYVLPIGFLLLVGAGYYGLKNYNLKDRFTDFHKQKNRELHSRPVKNIADFGVGENWVIEGFEKGDAKPMALEEARLACRNRGYELYNGESFNFIPPLVLNHSAYFWSGNIGGQLGPGEVTKPSSYVRVQTEPMHLTLCVRP